MRRPALSGAQLDHASQLIVAKAAQRDRRALAPERADEPLDLRAAVGCRLLERDQHEDRCVWHAARDELEHQQRGGIGRVDVVEHDHERLAGRDVVEERANRVEQREARLLRARRGVAGGGITELGEHLPEPAQLRPVLGLERRAVA